jgi:hypothetical protein
MEHQLDATVTVLLISKISSTCFGQTFVHLQERKTEIFTYNDDARSHTNQMRLFLTWYLNMCSHLKFPREALNQTAPNRTVQSQTKACITKLSL